MSSVPCRSVWKPDDISLFTPEMREVRDTTSSLSTLTLQYRHVAMSAHFTDGGFEGTKYCIERLL